ncbi:MAG: DUF5615 family PIN-like protein [Candidatus Eisenbacteria bacterium]
MTPPRLLADDMLGRLARWLRGAGLDTAYAGDGAATDDDDILRRARREKRIVVTRDQRFPGGPEEVIVVESRGLGDQLVEVLRRFPEFDPLARPFSRCMECNGEVRPEDDPPGRPAGTKGPFTRCDDCGRLFWEGSHAPRIREKLGRAKQGVERVVADERAGVPRPIERAEFDRFLEDALPLLGFSWRGYRRVRFGLRTRIRRRMADLGIRTLDVYGDRVRRDREERRALRRLLRVTISRFFRDRALWLRFPAVLFPDLVLLAGDGPARIWSLGCASGEEPFTLRMVWDREGPAGGALEIMGGDISEDCLARAREGLYPESALHNTPPDYRERYFRPEGGLFRLDRHVTGSVRFERFDWADDDWPGPFHGIFARNGMFTYLDGPGRRRASGKIAASLLPGGFLWIGGNERLPEETGWERTGAGLFRKNVDG